ncbi:hypothetical protein EON65_57150 [archaeon]|nr:MAG: hypothetical protein EON65_57150 [archaeon]
MDSLGDDEVIREVDVVVCDYSEMFLTQFPTKPDYADLMPIQSAKYKPENRQLELRTPYFKSQSSDTPVDADGQAYISTEIVPMNSLGAGFISNNVMYIVPIEGIYQMRPSLQQYNKLKQEVVEPEDDMDDEDMEEEAVESSAPNATMQQVQLKRKESEKAQSARMQSYSFLKQKEEAEAWRKMTVFPIGMLLTWFSSELLI